MTGKRVLQLQASLSFINAAATNPLPPPPDVYGRTPFHHLALDGIQGLTEESKSLIENTQNLEALAVTYGLDMVIRWKPKEVSRKTNCSLAASREKIFD